jgi:hypothetical protein
MFVEKVPAWQYKHNVDPKFTVYEPTGHDMHELKELEPSTTE